MQYSTKIGLLVNKAIGLCHLAELSCQTAPFLLEVLIIASTDHSVSSVVIDLGFIGTT